MARELVAGRELVAASSTSGLRQNSETGRVKSYFTDICHALWYGPSMHIISK